MSLLTRSQIAEIEARGGLDTQLTDEAGEDISGGVSTDLMRASNTTLYLEADGAVDVHVYLSPFEDGSRLFEPKESPLVFEQAGKKAPVLIKYAASYVQLVGSNATPVWARVEEVV